MTETEIAFAQEQIKLAKYLQSLSRAEEIKELCAMHNCRDKIRKLHAKQFLEERWNPHPSERFVRWWMNRGWQDTEEATDRGWSSYDPEKERTHPIKPTVAYNCEAVREVYRTFLQEQRMEMQ